MLWQVGCYGISSGEARHAAKHHTMHRTAVYNIELSGPKCHCQGWEALLHTLFPGQGVKWELNIQCFTKGRCSVVVVIISFVLVAWGFPMLYRDPGFLGSVLSQVGGEAELWSQSKCHIRNSTMIYWAPASTYAMHASVLSRAVQTHIGVPAPTEQSGGTGGDRQ